jgi:hypothetical protein
MASSLPAVHSSVGMATDGLLQTSLATVASAATTSQTRRLGTDLDLPLDPNEAIRVTPTGDLPVLSGRPNVQAAQRRRALVAPGGLVHRGDYGGGMVLELGQPGTPSRRTRLANQIRRNALRDTRIDEARVEVGGGPPGGLLVSLAIRISGDQADEQFSIALE